MSQKEVVGKVILLGTRLSFASLFEPNEQEQDDGTIRKTWKSNFLFEKNKLDGMLALYKGKKMPVLKAVQAASRDAKAAKWGAEEKWPKLKADRTFWRDGDEENWDGYAGCWYISANAQLGNRPAVVTNRKDGNGNWIEAEAGGRASPYSGCYVNATIQVWCQDNKHGKRVNAELKAIQFFKDGEAFGAAPTNPNDDFTDDMAGSESSIADDEGDNDVVQDDDDSLV